MIGARVLLIAAAVALAGPPAGAQGGADDVARGEAAFAAGDYVRAAALWSAAAARGDPEATLALALLRDGGYGGARDPGAAFDLFLKAARMGLDRAQFNVAVMLDAGLGTDRDARAAMLWYTRAALRGNLRARYNLGLLLESDAAGPADSARARFWYEAAASLPAAAARLRTVVPEGAPDAAGQAPEMLFASREGGMVELVWRPAGSGGGAFEVEILDVPDAGGDYAPPVAAWRTAGTGLLRDDPSAGRPTALRVVLADEATRGYEATDWALGDGPAGRVTIEIAPSRPAMRRLADVVAGDLRSAGIWVRIRERVARHAALRAGPPPPPPPEATEVTFAWSPDAAFAADVAALMPVLSGDAARLDPEADLRPGEIMVRIAEGG